MREYYALMRYEVRKTFGFFRFLSTLSSAEVLVAFPISIGPNLMETCNGNDPSFVYNYLFIITRSIVAMF